MINYHYWQYFLSLETDLITTSRYIEFTGVRDINEQDGINNNAKTFSTELVRIFLTACAECENILKILVAPRLPNNIIEIQEIIMKESSPYRTLSNQTISCPAYSLDFTPWKAWNTSRTSPQWWQDHNDVKHGREIDSNSNYHLANLYNTLNSVAALMCLLLEYYKKKLNENQDENHIQDSVYLPPVLAPKLFTPKESGLGLGNRYWVCQQNF